MTDSAAAIDRGREAYDDQAWGEACEQLEGGWLGRRRPTPTTMVDRRAESAARQ